MTVLTIPAEEIYHTYAFLYTERISSLFLAQFQHNTDVSLVFGNKGGEEQESGVSVGRTGMSLD
jgi:hypothetical protein